MESAEDEEARLLAELNVRRQVRAALQRVIERVCEDEETACANVGYERAVRLLSSQLEETREELAALKRSREADQENARELVLAFQSEISRFKKIAVRCAKAEKEAAGANERLAVLPERLEEVSSELADANQRNQELAQQVEALLDVQKELQQHQWLYDVGARASSRSSSFDVPNTPQSASSDAVCFGAADGSVLPKKERSQADVGVAIPSSTSSCFGGLENSSSNSSSEEAVEPPMQCRGIETLASGLLLPYLDACDVREAALASKRMLVLFQGKWPKGMEDPRSSIVSTGAVGMEADEEGCWKCKYCAASNESFFPICQFCKSPNSQSARESVEELERFCEDLRISTPTRRPSLLARIGPYIRGRSSTSSSKSSQNSCKGGSDATGVGDVSSSTATSTPKKVNRFADLPMDQLRMVLAIDKRAKQLEKALVSRTTEMEDLRARNNTLTHTKQVLVDTIAEKEEEICKALELYEQARAQTQSDREIISYLDTRSQELEFLAEDANSRLDEKDTLLEQETEKSKALQTALEQVSEESSRLHKERERLNEEMEALRDRVETLETMIARTCLDSTTTVVERNENQDNNRCDPSPPQEGILSPKSQGVLHTPPPQNEAPVHV